MRNTQLHMLKYIKKGDKCAEIGVWQGDLSRAILKHKPSELHLIDPWASQDVIKRCYSINQAAMDQIYKRVLNIFSKLNEVTVHRNFQRMSISQNSILTGYILTGTTVIMQLKKT